MTKCETCNSEGRVECPECGGNPLEMDCPECEGSGLVEREVVDEDGEYTGQLEEFDCQACDGRGHLCRWCDDAGSVSCGDCLGPDDVADA